MSVPDYMPTIYEEDEDKLWQLMVGISSIVGFVWWLVWGFFIYIKTNKADPTMLVNSGSDYDLVPIAWFWTNFDRVDLGWTAFTYFFIFMGYLIVAVPEFIFAFMVLVDVEPGLYLFNLWARYPGLYGSWILYVLPVIFPIVQLAHLNGDI